MPARRPRGHIILWWWSRQLRWPVALLALLAPRLVGRRLLRPVLHPRADGLEQAVDDGDGDRARPSDEGGGDDGVLQPDGHLDDSWTGDNKSRARVARPMPHPESDRGLLREALRPLPQADAVSWVAAPRVYQSGPTGLPSSCSPGMAPGTAWPPASAGLLSMSPPHRRCPRTPRQTTPAGRMGRIVTRRRPPKDWAGHETNRAPVTMRYLRVTPIPRTTCWMPTMAGPG